MTGAVPPGTFEPFCTVVLPSIIIIVEGAELGSFLGQRLPKLPINAGIDYSELEEFSSYDEVIDKNLCLVSVPVLHLYEKLLWLGQGQVVPVRQPNPVVLCWIPKSILVRVPALQEEVL